MKDEYRVLAGAALVGQFQSKIFTPRYQPASPEETVCDRAAATLLLNSHDSVKKIAAIAFLKMTSVVERRTDAEIERLEQLVASIGGDVKIEILSRYHTEGVEYCEYRFTYRDIDEKDQIIHQHAQFQQADTSWEFADQKPQKVRVVGDPVLHEKGRDFPLKPTPEELEELKSQVAQAKAILIETGGGGIAANQCNFPNPYNFTLVGVYNDDPIHVANVEARYDVKFPDAKLMINPRIVSQAETTEPFPHACLSMPNGLRGVIHSPTETTVAYLTLEGDDNLVPHEETYKHEGDVGAIVLFHELSHILSGKMFFDHALAALKPKILQELLDIVTARIEARRGQDSHELKVPGRYVVFDGEGNFDQQEFGYALDHSTDYVLQGMQDRIKFHLQAKPSAGAAYHGAGASAAEPDAATPAPQVIAKP